MNILKSIRTLLSPQIRKYILYFSHIFTFIHIFNSKFIDLSIPYIVPYAEYWDTRMSKKNGNVNKLLQCTMQLVLAQHEFELQVYLKHGCFSGFNQQYFQSTTEISYMCRHVCMHCFMHFI